MQLFSFYSCKERSLLNWITQRLITGGRNCPTQDVTLPITNNTANTVAATAPEGSSHPQSPQPSPEVLSSTTPVHQLQKWPSCQLPVSHPFAFPKPFFWFSAHFILTLCQICLDGMWAPLRIPLPQFFHVEPFPVTLQALGGGSESPSSATLLQMSSPFSSPNPGDLGASGTTLLVTIIQSLLVTCSHSVVTPSHSPTAHHPSSPLLHSFQQSGWC